MRLYWCFRVALFYGSRLFDGVFGRKSTSGNLQKMNLDQFNKDVTKATSTINTVASAALAVENMAATAVAAGAASLTGAQKLQIATGIATALDPAIAPLGPAINALFAAVVTGWHLAGVFTSSSGAAAPVAAAAPVQAPITPANYTPSAS